MLYEILIYIGMYFIDMSSAVVLWKMKPNLFDAAEANQQFKNLLKKYPVPKAILLYTLFVGLQYLVIVFFAIFLTSRIVLGNWDFFFALRFTLIFMIFVHFFGLLTNLTSMMKEEIKLK